jgi:hypothetical protein
MKGEKISISSIIGIAFILSLVLLGFGCATTSTTQQYQYWSDWQQVPFETKARVLILLHVNSEPTDAKIYVNDQYVANTPFTVYLDGKVGRVQFVRYFYVGGTQRNMESRWGAFTGKGDCWNITVYKEGFKRESRQFCADNSIVRKNFPDHEPTAGLDSYPPPRFEQHWTAFLQKDSGPEIDLDLKIRTRQPK